MKTVGSFKAFCFYAGKAMDVGSPVLITLFGVFATYPVEEGFEERRPIVHHFYAMVHDNLAIIFAGLCGLYVLGKALKSMGDPWAINKLQYILDGYREKVFRKIDDDGKPMPMDHNRVTLFQFKRNVFFVRHWSIKRKWWPWGYGDRPFLSNYLIPILRSGHVSKNTHVSFYVSDNGDDAEGLAGAAWASQSIARQDNLPLITRGCRKQAIKEYASDTQCSQEMIKHYHDIGKQLPRSICVIPIERNNKNWGVLVLDSRYPDVIMDDAASNYTLTIAVISHLLERL